MHTPFEQTLFSIACIGENADGSITRPGFSKAYFAAVEATKKLMHEAGMHEIFVDAIGNVCGIWRCGKEDCKTIMVGSHLDTVPGGGKYDGVYGVVAAIEAVRSIIAQNPNAYCDIEVWGFNSEESSPFGGTFGSRAVCGQIKESQENIHEALASVDCNFAHVLACSRDLSKVACYLELHIEQGGLLHSHGLDVGVVSGIVGITRYEITAIGQSNHAGTTMMPHRRDALVAMAKLIVDADAFAKKLDPTFVLTPGTISVTPGAANVITGSCTVCFEMRHLDHAYIEKMLEYIQNTTKSISEQSKGISWKITKLIDKLSTQCDPHIVSTLETVCQQEQIKFMTMPSGAGHDANPLAHCVPVGMLFVPSKDGISHSKEEYTHPEHLLIGQKALAKAIAVLASG